MKFYKWKILKFLKIINIDFHKQQIQNMKIKINILFFEI